MLPGQVFRKDVSGESTVALGGALAAGDFPGFFQVFANAGVALNDGTEGLLVDKFYLELKPDYILVLYPKKKLN